MPTPKTSDQSDDYPIELELPDSAPYRAGNCGVEWITSFDSGQAGPHVMLSALVHGNEVCGAIALDWLFRQGVRPRRGRLSLAFMNVAAYLSFDAAEPTASRFLDQDFNRVWQAASLDGDRKSRELARARAVRPVVETVDLLLDLHSMQHKTPALMLSGPLEKGRALWYRNRYVRTPSFLESERRVIGEDGRVDLSAGGPANTHVIGHAGRILALVEIAHPTQVGVDPVSWIPHHLGEESPRCRRAAPRTRRSSGSRWWIWSERVERPRSFLGSSSRQLSRSGTGSVRPRETRVFARTARPRTRRKSYAACGVRYGFSGKRRRS